MFHRTKVVDIELGHPLGNIEGLDGYDTLQGLVRLHDAPIGYVSMPVTTAVAVQPPLARPFSKRIAQRSYAISCVMRWRHHHSSAG